MGPLMLRFIFQLGVIIISARLGGFLLKKILKLPGVLGELVTGMLIGPYALGSLSIPGWGSLFPLPMTAVPVSPELYAIATLASIVLLFLSGLETDLATFLRYSVVGSAVGIGGVIVSFVLGDLCAIFFHVADSFMSPAALFMGTISTATSVGITARILSEKRKMDSPEGVTILAGAVLDDVIGIIVLAIVVGMSKVAQASGVVNWHHILVIALKALTFWVVCTALGLLLARRVTQLLKLFKSAELIASLAFGLALLLAGLSEKAGLAMIIGAYIMGLSLSRTDLVQLIQHELQGLYNALIPVFFCVMGMLVDFRAMSGVVVFGFIYSIVAILSKLVGCGVPAWLMKFSFRGAMRVGIGMVPRGEVALIVAGIGLSTGTIQPDVFGVAIMMTMITTVIAPPLLVKSFEGGSSLRAGAEKNQESLKTISLDFPSTDLAEFMMVRIANAFRSEEFYVYRVTHDINTFQVRKDDMTFSITHEGSSISMTTHEKHEHVLRLVVLEELLALEDLFQSLKSLKENALGVQLLNGLFDKDRGQ
ncbi:MAG: sodium:proton exchanger [Lentisphaerae bacterium GWF2_57_35]|nr:MAG: sodium:proton exchanger [Lentisphaerae bacterium GWF2_57_35]